jgi:geranylgeranyl pyrophosphate synthase
VIRSKTAKLFEAAAELGALISGATTRRSTRPANTAARWAPRSS